MMEAHDKGCLPIPPAEESIYLFLLLRIIKQIEQACIKSLRIGDLVCPGKDTSRAERKTHLLW